MEAPQIEGPVPLPRVFRFGVFELDTQSRELRRHGLKIRLPDQSFQILHLLLSHPGEVVTRDDLRRQLWTSETFVDFDLGLNSAIRKLREALEDSADNPRFVETLPRRGYRFIASLKPAIDPPIQKPVASVVALSNSRFGRRWIAGAVAVALTVAAAAFVYTRRGSDRFSAGIAPGQIRSLAVLPFENLSGDPGQDYFVDGVTDALTTELAQVSGPARHFTNVSNAIQASRQGDAGHWPGVGCRRRVARSHCQDRRPSADHGAVDSREDRSTRVGPELRGCAGGHDRPAASDFARDCRRD
jgi:DNA-binding winged helix-turn-helix (wHTH) protein